MNGYFAAGRLSEDEKNDILKLHSSVYNGYRTMQPEVKNEQPLYVYDPAQDKIGAVMSNKGEVKPYTNVGINESTDQKEVCNECGGLMSEGECSECGWKGEVGDMEEGLGDLGKKAKDWMDKPFSPDVEDYIKRVLDIIDNPEKKGDDDEMEFAHDDELPIRRKKDMDEDSDEPSFMDKAWDTAKDVGMFVASNPEILAALEEDTDEEVCECGGIMREGECSECGYKMGGLEEETGHLDDIYHEEDLNPSDEFDYVKGATNKTNAFHIKEDEADDYINYDDNEDDFEDNFEDPDNEDDGFEDINASEVTDEIEEQGGNAPDFDVSNLDSAYNFKSKGPESGDGPYDEKAFDMDLDDEEVGEPYDFSTGGPGIGAAYPVYEDDCDECYEKMESAWTEEMDETDVSGVQGIYGDMEPAYDFDSEGPGKAGPYQHNQYTEGETDEQYLPKHVWDDAHKKGHVKSHKELGIGNDESGYEGEDEDAYWEKDLEDGELDLDFEKFNPRDKSWSEITAHTGDDEFSHVDEDIRESVVNQKNKIMEMMTRMKVI